MQNPPQPAGFSVLETAISVFHRLQLADNSGVSDLSVKKVLMSASEAMRAGAVRENFE